MNDKYGFVDKQGKLVIPIQYNNVFGFYNGLAGVYVDKKIGFINKKGEMVIPPIYEQIQPGEGIIGVITGDKAKFLDSQGK